MYPFLIQERGPQKAIHRIPKCPKKALVFNMFLHVFFFVDPHELIIKYTGICKTGSKIHTKPGSKTLCFLYEKCKTHVFSHTKTHLNTCVFLSGQN
jgi:hypothetical protein